MGDLTARRVIGTALVPFLGEGQTVHEATDAVMQQLHRVATDFADGGRPCVDLTYSGGRFVGDHPDYLDEDEDWEEWDDDEFDDDEDDDEDDDLDPFVVRC